ncbi:MAG: MBL fold metallo-hydrolase, partial [Bacteroidota bacterium]
LAITLPIGLFYFSLNYHVSIGDYEKWYEGVNTEVQNGDVKVQFAGITTLLISDDSTTILTDGFFSRFPSEQFYFDSVAPKMEDITWALERLGNPEIDAVFTGHSHFDHAMDAPEVAKRTGALLYGSRSTANIARGWQLPERQIRLVADKQPVQIGEFKVTPILSNHYIGLTEDGQAQFPKDTIDEENLVPLVPPVKIGAYKMGGAYNFLITHPNDTFLIVPSAGWRKGSMENIRANKILLGIGGFGAQTAEYQSLYFQETVDKVQANQIYLIHWDGFSGPIQEPMMGPALFLDYFGIKTQKAFEAVEREVRQRPQLKVNLLPQWTPVVL